ncbi:hypothetical protein BVRB_030900, partial [Beta vulgaris subsp. vulgaris]
LDQDDQKFGTLRESLPSGDAWLFNTIKDRHDVEDNGLDDVKDEEVKAPDFCRLFNVQLSSQIHHEDDHESNPFGDGSSTIRVRRTADSFGPSESSGTMITRSGIDLSKSGTIRVRPGISTDASEFESYDDNADPFGTVRRVKSTTDNINHFDADDAFIYSAEDSFEYGTVRGLTMSSATDTIRVRP